MISSPVFLGFRLRYRHWLSLCHCGTLGDWTIYDNMASDFGSAVPNNVPHMLPEHFGWSKMILQHHFLNDFWNFTQTKELRRSKALRLRKTRWYSTGIQIVGFRWEVAFPRKHRKPMDFAGSKWLKKAKTEGPLDSLKWHLPTGEEFPHETTEVLDINPRIPSNSNPNISPFLCLTCAAKI